MENDEIKKLRRLVSGYQLRINNLANQYSYALNELSDCQKKYDLLLNDFTELQKQFEELKDTSKTKTKTIKKSKSLSDLGDKPKQKTKQDDILNEVSPVIPLSRVPTLADVGLFEDSTEDLSSVLPDTMNVSDIDSDMYIYTPRTKTLVDQDTLRFGDNLETEDNESEMKLPDMWGVESHPESPPSSELPVAPLSEQDKSEEEVPFFEVKIRKEKRGGGANRKKDELSDDEFFYY